MKSLALASLMAAILAPAAMALPHPQLLTKSDMQEIKRQVPSADLTTLTAEEAAALSSALHSSDNYVGAEIRAILN